MPDGHTVAIQRLGRLGHDSGLVLYGYWRSSAAYRVRIALNLKGLDYESAPGPSGARRRRAACATTIAPINPQELVPALLDGDRVFTQSLAIIEYLDEMHPERARRCCRSDARGRARVRALAMVVACDIHPLGNLRVLQHWSPQFGADRGAARGMVAALDGARLRRRWKRCWPTTRPPGRFCHGDTPGLADICLVPQVLQRAALEAAAGRTTRPSAGSHEACGELEASSGRRPKLRPMRRAAG